MHNDSDCNKGKGGAMRPKWFERGQGLIEYAMIFVLVIILVIVLVVFFGEFVGKIYSDIVYTI